MKPIFQQLLEAKSILLEDFEDDAKTIMGKDLAGAVASLKTKASDSEFQQGATSGKSDGADDDEEVSSNTHPVPATKMFPTQQEIGFGNSLEDLVKDKYEQIDNAFNSPVEMSSADGKTPILVADIGGNIAILDGHHRWSLCFMINPDADMSCDILKGDFDSAEDALKAMQFAIAAKAGKVVTKGFEGKDLMSTSTKEVEQYIKDNIIDSAIEKFKKYKPEIFKEGGDDKDAVASYIGEAHKKIVKMKGPYTRPIMPQAGASGVDQSDVNKALAQGAINFNEPYIKEAFQIRAGIKK